MRKTLLALALAGLALTACEPGTDVARPAGQATDAAPADPTPNFQTFTPPAATPPAVVVEKAPSEAKKGPVQIHKPKDGAILTAGDITFSGKAEAFEAHLDWTLYKGGSLHSEGFTMTSEGMTLAPFSFTLDLHPGTYRMRITQSDPSGGEGRPPAYDEVNFTVVDGK